MAKSKTFYLGIFVAVSALIFVGALVSGLVKTEKMAENISSAINKIPRPKFLSSSYKELLEQGDAAAKTEKKEDAANYYNRAADIEPRDYQVYEKIGDLYESQHRFAEAGAQYQMAHSLNPQKQELIIKAAKTLLHARKIFDARVLLEKIEPPTQHTHYYLGLIAAFLNEQEKAQDLLKKSFASQAANEELKNKAQKVLTAYREFEVSQEAPIEYLQAQLAATFEDIGEYGLALELGFAALKSEPNYRDVWIILGHAYLNLAQLNDAEAAFTKALTLDAGHPTALYFRGLTKNLSGKKMEAARDFEDALKNGWQPVIGPKLELAEIYFSQQEYEKSFAMYKDVVLLDHAEIGRFVRPVAIAINQLNKPHEALALAQKGVSAHPGSALAQELVGWAYLVIDDRIAARSYLQQAIALDPTLDIAYLHLGQVAAREGKIEEARAHFEKAQTLAEKTTHASIATAAKNLSAELNTRGSAPLPIQKTPQNAIVQPPQILEPQKKIPSLNLL